EEEVAIAGEVRRVSSRRGRGRLTILTAIVSDGSGSVPCVWFNQQWLQEKLQPGTRVRLRGALRRGGFNVKAYDLGEDGGEPGELILRYRKALPFALTPYQEQAIRELDADLARPLPMQRLLQGDVGSGKTVVALYALLRAVEQGRQGALMAPTETLAEQHF